MFLNDTVRGPYIDPLYAYDKVFFKKLLFWSNNLMIQKDFHFTDVFARLLTNETKIVGSYLNCGTFGPGEVYFFFYSSKQKEIVNNKIKIRGMHTYKAWLGWQMMWAWVPFVHISSNSLVFVPLLESNFLFFSFFFYIQGATQVDGKQLMKVKLECLRKWFSQDITLPPCLWHIEVSLSNYSMIIGVVLICEFFLGVDFRKDEVTRQTCNSLQDPTYQKRSTIFIYHDLSLYKIHWHLLWTNSSPSRSCIL